MVAPNFDCGDEYDPDQPPLLTGYPWPNRLEGASFRNCLFSGSIGPGLSGFDNLNLARTDFSGAHFETMRFIATNLNSARLVGTHFEGMQFLQNGNQRCVLDNAVATGSDWSGSTLSFMSMTNINLSGARFYHSEIEGGVYIRASFRGATLDGMSFRGSGSGDFSGADFRDVVSPLDGSAAIFTGVTLNQTDWRQAGQPYFVWRANAMNGANVTGLDLSRSYVCPMVLNDYLRGYSVPPMQGNCE